MEIEALMEKLKDKQTNSKQNRAGIFTDGGMVAVIPCSGVSNTGKITTFAARTLMFRKPATFKHITSTSTKIIEDSAREADRVVVLDGCHDLCATKKLEGTGIIADIHIILTNIGIQKSKQISQDVDYQDIETAVKAVMDAADK